MADLSTLAKPPTKDATTGNLTPTQTTATDLSGLANIISLIMGTDKTNASTVANIADPFASQRPQYMDDLSAFMKDPSSIFNDPAFTAAEGVGAENIARTAGAAGMGNSGNKLASLYSFGQSSALSFENQKFNELLPLSGATTGSPAAAALATQTGQTNQANTISGAITGLSSLLTQAGIPAAVANQIAQALGGGGANPFSGGNPTIPGDMTTPFDPTDPFDPFSTDTGLENIGDITNGSLPDLGDLFASLGIG